MRREVSDTAPQVKVLGRAYSTHEKTRSLAPRRSRIELYVEILRAIHRGCDSPSKIVYAANLSYDRVLRCLGSLEERNLVVRKPGKEKAPRYRLAPEGMEVIGFFTKLQSALPNNRRDNPTRHGQLAGTRDS